MEREMGNLHFMETVSISVIKESEVLLFVVEKLLPGYRTFW
jgi:hypothetical protein